MALMAVARHHGHPHTPTDQAWIETLFGHIKGEWPHPEEITEASVLEVELARVRSHEEQSWMIRRYIAWRNRHTDNEELRTLSILANVG